MYKRVKLEMGDCVKMESFGDCDLPEIMIDHLTTRNPKLRSRNRSKLVSLASKSLSYLDYMINVEDSCSGGLSSQNDDAENVVPNIPTYVSWKIMDTQLDEEAKKEMIVICLNHDKFYKILKDIKGEFIARWEPEYADQIKICFCLDATSSDIYCRVIKGNKRATISWNDLYMDRGLIYLFVKDLWEKVLQLA